MEHIYESKAAGNVYCSWHSSHRRHVSYAAGTDKTTIVMQIRLDNIHPSVLDHPSKSMLAVFLFTARKQV